MKRDEKPGAAFLGIGDPVAQANEDIILPGHLHPITTGGLDLLLELHGIAQHEGLLVNPGSADRAGIDAAVAGIDDNNRAAVTLGLGRGQRDSGLLRPRQGRAGHQRRTRTGEIVLAADRLQIDDQAVAVAVVRRQGEDLLEVHGLTDVEHDPAGARSEKPISQGLYQAAALHDPPRAEAPIKGRQIDHHAKRIGQGKSAIGRQLRQLQHETGLVGMHADSHVRHARPGQRQGAAQDQGE